MQTQGSMHITKRSSPTNFCPTTLIAYFLTHRCHRNGWKDTMPLWHPTRFNGRMQCYLEQRDASQSVESPASGPVQLANSKMLLCIDHY